MTTGLNDVLGLVNQLTGSSSTGVSTTGSSSVVTYKGKKYRQVSTSGGNMLIPLRRSRRIVIGEKGLMGVLSLIRTGASLARSRGRSGSFSFRPHRKRRTW